MNLPGRMALFITPIAFAAICKATLASAAGGAELAIYESEPAKLVDLSIDFLLTATAVLLGVLLYVQSGTATTTPAGGTIRIPDLVICSAIQVGALILIFASTLGLPHVPYVHDHLQALAKIWLPDLIGLFAFAWVIIKLT